MKGNVFILLSDTIEHQLVDPIDSQVLRALENLGAAHDEGKHWLGFSSTLMRRLKGLPALGARARAAFTRTTLELGELSTVRSKVGAYVIVEALGAPWVIDVPSSEGRPCVFHVGLEYFADSERIQATSLVGEDLRDANLYRRFAEAYRIRHERGSRIMVRGVNGGGATTGRVFAQQALRGPTLCVVDSDAANSGPEPDKTSSKVLASLLALRTQKHVAHARVLKCHELENLIPGQLFLDSAPAGQRRQLVEKHQGLFGRADTVDLKALVARDLLQWVEDFVTNISDANLAKTYLAGDLLPELRDICVLLWSWGLAPPEGKRRI